MFKLDVNPTFEATVQISEPGGTQRPLKVVFKHKKRSEMTAWLNAPQTDLEMALDIVASVSDLDAGVTLKDFFERLFENYPASALDLYFTYRRELLESRAKN